MTQNRGFEGSSSLLPPGVSLPTTSELRPYLPDPRLHYDPYREQHGVAHGAEVMVFASIILKNLPEELSAHVDKAAVLVGAANHDMGRYATLEWTPKEMKEHGPRGADHFEDVADQLAVDLSEEQIAVASRIIRYHTPTHDDVAQARRDKKAGRQVVDIFGSEELQDIDPSGVVLLGGVRADLQDPEKEKGEQLSLGIVRMADKVGLARGLFGRTPYDTGLVPLSRAISIWRGIRSSEGRVHDSFPPNTRRLYLAARVLGEMTRQDPDINRLYWRRSRVAEGVLESAIRIGIVRDE